nr:octopamine receptor beta-1R-like [Hydra vulgaris]
MICWRTNLLELPNLKIFGILLIIPILAAIVCNFCVFIVIVRMQKRAISNYLLMSLSISDLLVGIILGPLTLAQVFDINLLSNCTAHFIRSYFLVLLGGSSLLTLAVIAYDRYLLMTKLTNYNKYMTKRWGFTLVGFSWIFPGTIPIAKILNMNAYVVLRILNFTLSVVALGTFYFLIIKALNNKRVEFRQNNQIYQSVSCYSQVDKNINKQNKLIKSSVNYFLIKNLKRQKYYTKVAKSVTLLFTCYFAFIFPLNIWLILEISNVKYDVIAHRIFYLCAIFLMQANSCINPLIYYLKQKDIKNGLRQVYKSVILKKSISSI